jgi:outer membrane protein OmpA-like peptidoglycan-associated protein
MPNISFYIAKTGRMCDGSSNNNSKTITYKGKLLTGKVEKEPLSNQKVILKDNKNIEVQSTTTDKYGDFNFQTMNTKNYYKIEVVSSAPNVKDDQIYIAKQDGSNIRTLKKVGNNFVYELLPIELTKISEEKIDDTKITLKDFSSSAKKELTVTKDVYYNVNSADITADSKQILDDIVKSLQENKILKVSIISHTDSKGDDNSNLLLSEKRAKNVLDYFISKGIEKSRLSSKGMGESKVINRCKNGVDCSEEEHKLNRRTEFIFSK